MITDGNNVVQGCYRAWVWVKQSTTGIQPVAAGCRPFTLHGSYASNNGFTYYNPPPDPFIVNANTTITVCFTANHTYVSDLGFFMVSPSGGTVTLSPNPGANGQGPICNPGRNVNNLCFTTGPAANFNPCTAAAPYTGTYRSYGPGNTPINWAPIYGSDATQGGWKVQIYDCIAQDVGSLRNATITFTGNASCGQSTITYNSGNINSAINDNSCTPQSASIYTVPPPPPTAAQTISSTTTYSWSANPPVIGFPINGSLTVNVDSLPKRDTWFYLTTSNSIGCLNIDSVFFHYTPPDTPTIAPPRVFCFNGPGDTLSVDVRGGVWSGTGITDSLTGFFNPSVAGPGQHRVIYTAQQPCGTRDTVMVTVSEKITFSSSTRKSTCFGADNGSVTVNLLTGHNPVTGTWLTNPPQNGYTDTGLAPGQHTLVLTDGYGCRDTSRHTTTEPAVLALTTSKTDVSCPNGSNGQILVAATGGTLPYSYTWNPAQAGSSTASSLPQGNYTVTVTDSNGCTKQAVVNLVTLSVPPTIQGTVKDESCPDLSDAAIDLTVTGGTGPFYYLWTNNETTEDIAGITAGNYSVTVSDVYQCPYTKDFVVVSGNSLNFSYSVSDLLCHAMPTGLISVTPLNGNPPYHYFLNGVDMGTAGQLSKLSAGNYTVTIIDSKGCDTTFSTSVSQPPPIYADSTSHEIRLGDHITLTPTFGGGTGNLSMRWLPYYNLNCSDCAQPVAWPNRTTHYDLVVTDQNGCVEHARVFVEVLHDGPFIPNAFTPGSKDDLNNVWKVSDYGVEQFDMLVFDRWGNKMFQTNNIYDGWEGKTPGGKLCELGTYAYKVYIRYIDGTEKTLLGHVSILR